jgi:3-hydroxyisobutyrate dehydrogenase-like beta-hydroxyacid dehydrogenase
VSCTADYLRCPVLGSVPAVEASTLTLLAGAAGVPEALTALGHIVPCGHTTTAATIKLVANSALATTLVALGDVMGWVGSCSAARRSGADLIG